MSNPQTDTLDYGSVLVDVSSKKFPSAVMVCDEHAALEHCIQTKWCVDSTTGYAVARVDGRKVGFHRLVIKAEEGQTVDHINNDRLDNRLANLRLVNRSANAHNRKKKVGASSQFVGVSWQQKKRKYKAEICSEGCKSNLGYYEEEMLAALAYDSAAKRLYGEVANVNFPCA